MPKFPYSLGDKVMVRTYDSDDHVVWLDATITKCMKTS